MHLPLPIRLEFADEFRDAVTSQDFRCTVVDRKDGPAELLLMGAVGDSQEGLTARQAVQFLSQNASRPIRVRINSPGGLAFDGITIYNALAKHQASVITEIEGLAASAAAIVAMAGRPVRMIGNGTLFIHRAMGMAVGNSLVMADLADFLGHLDRKIAATFAAKSGQTVE